MTDTGIVQAHAAADRLAASLPSAPARLWSSDQRRASQTAQIIGAAFGTEPVLTAALREQGLGVLEGRPTSELSAEPVPADRHITEVGWGGGESIEEVWRRLDGFVWPALKSVSDTESHDVIIVSHGDTLRVLVAVLAGIGHRNVAWDVWGNGEIRTVDTDLHRPAP